MTEHGNSLLRLAEILGEASREMSLAIEQCVRPHHLRYRGGRSAVKACRAIVEGVDLGVRGVVWGDVWTLAAIRNPDDRSREPAKIQIGEWKGELLSFRIGSGCDSNGVMEDDTALITWVIFICQHQHRISRTRKADAGAFDFDGQKTDRFGRLIGRDGKPLPIIEEIGSKHDGPPGWHLKGTPARAIDDLDGVERLERERCRVGDWKDVAASVADIFRMKATSSSIENGSDKLVAKTESGSVRLFGRGENPVVNGVKKDLLSTARYDAVLALLEAGDKGLTKDELDYQSGHGEARKLLRRLAKDDDWASVILFPGVPGIGYRLI